MFKYCIVTILSVYNHHDIHVISTIFIINIWMMAQFKLSYAYIISKTQATRGILQC